MQISNNTVLITGGGSGIGLSLAQAFAEAGNEVIVCGRSSAKLDAAQRRIPSLHTRVCDVTDAEQRAELALWALERFPDLNLLVNNAGTCQEADLLRGSGLDGEDLAVNLQAPVELITRFLPHLLTRSPAAIVNVSTALAYVPLAKHPLYCAAKAGLHSYTQSLRHQLKGSSIRVVEVLPPAVDTALNRSDVRKIRPEQVVQALLSALQRNRDEVRVGQARLLHVLSRVAPRLAFSAVNR